MYLCPLCQQPLTLTQRQYRCPSNHSFDLAREGYVNLLPVQHKKSKDPGDNQQMMLARRQFLQAGWYQPLVTAVIQHLQHYAGSRLLDLGCGEGYYSGQIQHQLPQLEQVGIDISKAAIRAAAKQYPAINFAVASSYQLPFADGYFDSILRIYAPSLDSELQRVLKPGGYLLSVSPAPEHLMQIKAAIYPEVRYHSTDIVPIAGFTHCLRQQLSFTLRLPAAALRELVTMVPLGWKFSPLQLTDFVNTEPDIHCDFYLDCYQNAQ